MQYLCLIYGDESGMKQASDADRQAMFQEYAKFSADVIASGHMVGGNALQPTSTATTIRVRDGKAITTDGPFAETREQLGGYYLITAENLDHAIRIAAGIPGAKYGSIEVRPVMQMPADYPRP
jgi:hypothetical protein